jgi:hypothetical protein
MKLHLIPCKGYICGSPRSRLLGYGAEKRDQSPRDFSLPAPSPALSGSRLVARGADCGFDYGTHPLQTPKEHVHSDVCVGARGRVKYMHKSAMSQYVTLRVSFIEVLLCRVCTRSGEHGESHDDGSRPTHEGLRDCDTPGSRVQYRVHANACTPITRVTRNAAHGRHAIIPSRVRRSPVGHRVHAHTDMDTDTDTVTQHVRKVWSSVQHDGLTFSVAIVGLGRARLAVRPRH